MYCKWEDLPKPLNVFTKRHTAMKNLNTGKIVQHYSANTRLTMAQKAVTDKGTFYRTRSAEHHNLNWAFEAEALGLPNEFAPPAPRETSKSDQRGPRTRPSPKTKTVPKTPRLRAESRKTEVHEEPVKLWEKVLTALKNMVK